MIKLPKEFYQKSYKKIKHSHTLQQVLILYMIYTAMCIPGLIDSIGNPKPFVGIISLLVILWISYIPFLYFPSLTSGPAKWLKIATAKMGVMLIVAIPTFLALELLFE